MLLLMQEELSEIALCEYAIFSSGTNNSKTVRNANTAKIIKYSLV